MSEKVMDYRSDTFTHPTLRMKESVLTCALGDDNYGEDPTVTELEKYAAELFGMEAAVFLPTCTMANLTAISVHCSERLSSFIVGDKQHIYNYEVGGASTVASVHPIVVRNQSDGTMDLDDVAAAIPKYDQHFPQAKMIAIENTNNLCGGRVLSLEYMKKLHELGKERNLKIHVDGARIFNALAVLKCDPKEIGARIDSISLCLSKGLCAPTGAILLGTSEFIKKARFVRKSLGGTLRQGGVIATFGLVALKEMRERLAEDNAHARKIVEGFSDIPEDQLHVTNEVESNMIYLESTGGKAKEITDILYSKHNIKIGNMYGDKMRMVTHNDVPIGQVNRTIEALKDAVKIAFSS